MNLNGSHFFYSFDLLLLSIYSAGDLSVMCELVLRTTVCGTSMGGGTLGISFQAQQLMQSCSLFKADQSIKINLFFLCLFSCKLNHGRIIRPLSIQSKISGCHAGGCHRSSSGNHLLRNWRDGYSL